VSLSRNRCEGKFSGFISGHRLLEVLNRRQLDERRLAQLAGTSEQTIRNYISSCPERPRKANSKIFMRICNVLGLEPEDLMLPFQDSLPLSGLTCEPRDDWFIGKSDQVRSVEGAWQASGEKIEISSSDLMYASIIPWNGPVLIRQLGSRVEGRGADSVANNLFAKGTLLEGGQWLRISLWVRTRTAGQYGNALLRYSDCGTRMEGLYHGRDADVSDEHIVVAKLLLKRQAVAPK
jgi:hypothetical protein